MNLKTDPAALDVQQVSYFYGQRHALSDVSFDVSPGAIVALLGPNGSGKTTLFRMIATLAAPASGSVSVFGADSVRESSAVRRQLGVVFQTPSLDKKLTAMENLRIHGELYGVPRRELAVRAVQLLQAASLGERSTELVEKFSGGMARRVEIAKALLHQPRLLLLDEPSTGLDPGARREMWAQLRGQRDSQGVTICFTTHLMDEAERADEVVVLDRGRLVARGSPGELRSRVGGDVVRIASPDPDGLLADVRSRFGEAALVDGEIRIESPGGHAFVPQLVEAFPGRVTAISVGQPTLEDVFIHYTGHRLYSEDAA